MEHYIAPTGLIVKEYLEANEMNQKELSMRTRTSEKHISNVLNSKARLTEEMAIKLEKVMPDVPASYWLNYESKYREYLARIKEKHAIETQDLSAISKRFKFAELYKGLQLTLVEQAIETLKLLRISSFEAFDETYNIESAFFMEDGGEREAVALWLRLSEESIDLQNESLDTVPYDVDKLKARLIDIKQIALNEDFEESIEQCRMVLNQVGVYLVLYDALRNSKVRGAVTYWENHPAIFLSRRYKTHDTSWFALIHEIGHLLLHVNQETIISMEGDTSQLEVEANQFARDFFVGRKAYDRFVLEGQFTDETILSFSKEQGLLAGMLVSFLHHDKVIPYNQFQHLKCRLE